MRIVQEGSDAAVLLAQAAHSAQLPSPPSISHLALMAVIAPENLALVSSLLQADVNELRQLDTQDKGKGKAVPTDEDVAFALFSQELASLVQAEQDAKLARSLAAAIETDRPVLEALAREEEAARADHALALRLSTEVDNDYDDCVVACQGGGWAPPAPGIAQQQQQQLQPAASTSAAATPPPRARQLDCIICAETLPASSLIRVPCKEGHLYCGDCLRALFLAATKDESLFPPRCDGIKIAVDLVKPLLSADELLAYQRKAVEFGTPRRLYCSTSTCSAFLGAASDGPVAAQCGACGTSTCAACKAPWHGPFGLCGASHDDEAARTLERDFEYKQCPRCKHVVELESGCHHMSVHLHSHSAPRPTLTRSHPVRIVANAHAATAAAATSSATSVRRGGRRARARCGRSGACTARRTHRTSSA